MLSTLRLCTIEKAALFTEKKFERDLSAKSWKKEGLQVNTVYIACLYFIYKYSIRNLFAHVTLPMIPRPFPYMEGIFSIVF